MATPKNFTKFLGVFNVAEAIVGILYALVGLCGYMKYGVHTKSTVIMNIPYHWYVLRLILFNCTICFIKTRPAKVAKILYCIAVSFSYALQGFVGFEIIWFNLMPAYIRDGKHSRAFEYCTRIGFVLTTCKMFALFS